MFVKRKRVYCRAGFAQESFIAAASDASYNGTTLLRRFPGKKKDEPKTTKSGVDAGISSAEPLVMFCLRNKEDNGRARGARHR